MRVVCPHIGRDWLCLGESQFVVEAQQVVVDFMDFPAFCLQALDFQLCGRIQIHKVVRVLQEELQHLC